MIFSVKRTSNYLAETAPCNGAVCILPYDDHNMEAGQWAIEITDLDHLMQFVSRYGKCVIRNDGTSHIEIYDGWRE